MAKWPEKRRFGYTIGRATSLTVMRLFLLHSVHETRIAAEREALMGTSYRIVSSKNPREEPGTGEFGRYALYLRTYEEEEVIETRAEELAYKTEDAFSFGLYYNRKEWRQIARYLLEQDYSDDEVEEILRSKHMRWAADHVEKDARSVTLADFQSYYTFESWTGKSNKESIEEMLHAIAE